MIGLQGYWGVLQGHWRMLRHGGLNDSWDGEKGYEAIEKSLYGDFIGSVQHRRHRPAHSGRLKGQAQAREPLWIGRIKMQRLHFEEIKRWQGIGEAVRIRQGIGNRDTHVRDAELGQDGAVVKFHHGMDDTL